MNRCPWIHGFQPRQERHAGQCQGTSPKPANETQLSSHHPENKRQTTCCTRRICHHPRPRHQRAQDQEARRNRRSSLARPVPPPPPPFPLPRPSPLSPYNPSNTHSPSALDFTSIALTQNLALASEELSVSFRNAYGNTLKPHHSFMVKPIFSAAMSACPYRKDFYVKLGEDPAKVEAELRVWLASLEKILAILKGFLDRKEAKW